MQVIKGQSLGNCEAYMSTTPEKLNQPLVSEFKVPNHLEPSFFSLIKWSIVGNVKITYHGWCWFKFLAITTEVWSNLQLIKMLSLICILHCIKHLNKKNFTVFSELQFIHRTHRFWHLVIEYYNWLVPADVIYWALAMGNCSRGCRWGHWGPENFDLSRDPQF